MLLVEISVKFGIILPGDKETICSVATNPCCQRLSLQPTDVPLFPTKWVRILVCSPDLSSARKKSDNPKGNGPTPFYILFLEKGAS